MTREALPICRRFRGTPRTRGVRQGFTLLEMMIALVVVMMIVGSAMAVLYLNQDEHKLKDTVSEIEVSAKRARAVASLQQRPYALLFTADGFELLPYAEAILAEEMRRELAQTEAVLNIDNEEIEDDSFGFAASEWRPPVRDSFPLREGMTLELMPWGAVEWQGLSRRDQYIWRFDPNGISEPLGVRVLMESGNWMSAWFHPLSAAIADTEYSIE